MHQFDAKLMGQTLLPLRRYVTVCCLIVAAALVAQLVVWALLAFTDVRFTEIAEPQTPKVVVHDKDPSRVVMPVGAEPAAPVSAEPGPIRVRSKFNVLFQDLAGTSMTAGTLALLVLLLLVTGSVLIAASRGAPGSQRLISAWVWTIIVAVLALPVWSQLRLPGHAALRTFEDLVAHAEVIAEQPKGSIRFLVLVVTCLLGTLLALLRFRSGVRLSVDDAPLLDPELEAEAANIKPSTLHGGRNAAAFGRALGGDDPEPHYRPSGSLMSSRPDPFVESGSGGGSGGSGGGGGHGGSPAPQPGSPESMPGATQVSPGQAPRRLI